MWILWCLSFIGYKCYAPGLHFFYDIDSVVFTQVITLFFSNPSLSKNTLNSDGEVLMVNDICSEFMEKVKKKVKTSNTTPATPYPR